MRKQLATELMAITHNAVAGRASLDVQFHSEASSFDIVETLSVNSDDESLSPIGSKNLKHAYMLLSQSTSAKYEHRKTSEDGKPGI